MTAGGVAAPPEAIALFQIADAPPLSAALAGVALGGTQILETPIEVRYAVPGVGSVDVAFRVRTH